jgi:hypothetical protein
VKEKPKPKPEEINLENSTFTGRIMVLGLITFRL